MENERIEALKKLLAISINAGLEKEALFAKYLITGKKSSLDDLDVQEINSLVSAFIDRGFWGKALSLCRKYTIFISQDNATRLAKICKEKGHYGLVIQAIIYLPNLVSKDLIEEFITVYLDFIKESSKERIINEENFRDRGSSLIDEIAAFAVAAGREITVAEIDKITDILIFLKR
ncbi:hypothetical protein KJ763_00595 [Patescibacteria group bacterium]|nr:hypothetical protein [Patescibacteria group bacterium]